jgi:hypothetical protein
MILYFQKVSHPKKTLVDPQFNMCACFYLCGIVRFDNVRFILMVLGIDLVVHDKAENPLTILTPGKVFKPNSSTPKVSFT